MHSGRKANHGDAGRTDEEYSLREMKRMARGKLLYIADCLQNGRVLNIRHELESVTSMLTDLSLITNVDVVLDYVENAVAILMSEPESCCTDALVPSTPQVSQGPLGRPSFSIPEETLVYLLDANFKVKSIANLLGVSKRTIERRLHSLGLGVSQTYHQMNDQEVLEKVTAIVSDYPGVGYRTVGSILKSSGYRIQEYRVRAAMKSVDPEGVLFRRLFLSTCRIQRRTYSVRGPQALWHMDGYHKLIRWRLVIHGCIDGYSRLPVFLRISSNNRAETVFGVFTEAVAEYGLPEKVRSDKGGENVEVAAFMVEKRGSKGFIAGRSVHNQRIERLWRELWCGVTSVYYHLFYKMESDGVLNVEDELHLAVLHVVYLPWIQRHLNQFREALMHRPLRTEGNSTPLQLWLSGQICDLSQSMEDLANFGIDFDGPISLDVDTVHVEVPDTTSILEQNTPIAEILGRATESTHFGVDIFQEVLGVLNSIS